MKWDVRSIQPEALDEQWNKQAGWLILILQHKAISFGTTVEVKSMTVS